jgi:Family of unknown function (DUF5681)
MGYKTGFGRPPKHTQFRKGQSGNPLGRPKGSKNFRALFDKVCEEMVTVNGASGQRNMAKLSAGLTQLVNKAANGDLKAIRMLIQWKKEVEDLAPILPTPIFVREFVGPRDVQTVAPVVDKEHQMNEDTEH